MNAGNHNRIGYSYEDWERHYDEKDLRWDLDEVAPPFVRLWEENDISPCKAIVPGCGAGHEVLFLSEKGFEVTAIDYTHGAVMLLEKALKKKKISCEVLCQDFFALGHEHDETFGLMLEHTFFCAINPTMRRTYVETASRIIKPGGSLIGLFYETGENDGPPFNTRREDIEECFSNSFVIKSLYKTLNSAEQRRGKEWLAVFSKEV